MVDDPIAADYLASLEGDLEQSEDEGEAYDDDRQESDGSVDI